MPRNVATMLVGATLMTVLACRGLSPVAGPHGYTSRGELWMDAAVSRRLEVVEHSFRRDASGRLCVRIVFGNTARKPLATRIRIEFEGPRQPTKQQRAEPMDYVFPPGLTAVEWTSYSQEADSYRVEVRAKRRGLW